MPEASAARSRLFLASCIALVATSMSFAIRGDIMGELEQQFALDKEELGWIAGTAFWGFTLSIVGGGPLCDVLGMRLLMRLALLGHAVGVAVTIFATGFWSLFLGTLAIGLANGFVEAACNPLIATVYPDSKTQKLNQFHVWFPGGVVIGGLLCYFLAGAGAGWQVKMATMLAPVLVYGVLFSGVAFPATERVQSGIKGDAMVRECGRPLFLLMLVCMVMTAATELGPNQWIPNILTTTAGVSGILVLVWINGLMAIGRQFAGPVVHRLSPTGMLLASARLGAAGLAALSVAASTLAVFAAATVFALGICYFWPTMLGFVAERLPRTGALGLALMGGTGMLSSAFVLPVMGRFYDQETAAAVARGLAEDPAKAAGGAAALQYVVVLPIALSVVFLLLFLADRARGGYRAEAIAGPPAG